MNAVGIAIQAFTFVGLPCLGALAVWLALRLALLDRLSPARWAWTAAGLFLLTRVGTHLVVFHLFRYSGGDDLLRVWQPIARAVLEGKDPVPFIDNLYGPGFPFVLASGLALSGGRYLPGIGVPFIVADGIALVLLLRIASRRFPENVARRLTMAVLLSPLLWHNEAVRSQDESMFCLFLLLTLDLLDRGREVPGVLAAAMGTVLTKAVFPLWVFPILIAAGGGWRRTATRVALAGVLTLAGVSAYFALGWDFPGGFHPDIDVRGSTSWFLVPGGAEASVGVFRAGLLMTALLCSAAGFLAARRGPELRDRAASGVVAAQSAFIVVGPFTLPPHLVQGLPFLAWQAVREGVCAPRLTWKASLLGLGFCLWQIPSVWLNSEFWRDYPALILAFVAFWGWTGWLALRGGTTSPAPSPG